LKFLALIILKLKAYCGPTIFLGTFFSSDGAIATLCIFGIICRKLGSFSGRNADFKDF